ncbi:uncharacterized protein A4U43_C04F10020 [Asparagus officinalis]|uniref:Uncharacterized protein n=1 Tax=Asparagus officinalis TaxID=4686 RepID=A0A5P1F2E2_ASPOF|nr:uncharacterized protein A4U43_C04F10020 [Asparagus officinalis]
MRMLTMGKHDLGCWPKKSVAVMLNKKKLGRMDAGWRRGCLVRDRGACQGVLGQGASFRCMVLVGNLALTCGTGEVFPLGGEELEHVGAVQKACSRGSVLWLRYREQGKRHDGL